MSQFSSSSFRPLAYSRHHVPLLLFLFSLSLFLDTSLFSWTRSEWCFLNFGRPSSCGLLSFLSTQATLVFLKVITFPLSAVQRILVLAAAPFLSFPYMASLAEHWWRALKRQCLTKSLSLLSFLSPVPSLLSVSDLLLCYAFFERVLGGHRSREIRLILFFVSCSVVATRCCPPSPSLAPPFERIYK